MVRRNQYDLLAPSDRPRWLTVRTTFGALVEAHELPAYADLHRAMADKAAQLRAEGWEPEGDAKYGVFFANRGKERIEVSMAHVPPGAPTQGPSIEGGKL
jgi:hypothetical protein